MAITDDKKAELIFKQSELALKKFFNRQSYEWKFSYALWTAIAIAIGFSIKGQFKMDISSPFFYGYVVISFVIFYAHKIFLDGVAKAHRIDKKFHHFFDKETGILAGVAPEIYEKGPIADAIREFRNWNNNNGKWARIPYLTITFILLSTLGCLLTAEHKEKACCPDVRAECSHKYGHETITIEGDIVVKDGSILSVTPSGIKHHDPSIPADAKCLLSLKQDKNASVDPNSP